MARCLAGLAVGSSLVRENQDMEHSGFCFFLFYNVVTTKEEEVGAVEHHWSGRNQETEQ